MSEIHGAVGSYVANALDPDERSEFQRHLEACPTCSREVQEFGETAAELSTLVQEPPPPMLRATVLTSIQRVRPLPPLSTEDPQTAPGPRSIADPTPGAEKPPARTAPQAAAPTPAEHGTATEPVDELALRRQRRTARLLALAVAATVVVALAMGGWVLNLRQQRQAQVADAAAQTQLLAAPDAKVYAKSMPDGTHVSFVVSKSLDKAMFVGANLADPGNDLVYKLWRIPSGTKPVPVPDNAFDGGGPRQVWLQGGLEDAVALAVTVEKDPNTPEPTTDPVAAVTL